MTHTAVAAAGAGVEPAAPATSVFVNGAFPRRRTLIVALSVLAGFVLTVVWSAEFVDQTIGHRVADGMLGHDPSRSTLDTIGAGIFFAFVSGLAGTFTACNIAVFGAVAPVVNRETGHRGHMRRALGPIGWISVGMLTVSAVYGAVVGLVGTRMPQFSTAPFRPGQLTPWLTQSIVVFGLIGLVMCVMGLAALGVVPDPFARVVRRFPNAPLVFMGGLVGAFLIGRPFPLFRQMFRDAADSGNPLYGAVAFSLQSIGNILVFVVLVLLLARFGGRRLQGWLGANAERIATVTGASFLVAGAFTILYWDVRLLARLEIIPWFPTAPWA